MRAWKGDSSEESPRQRAPKGLVLRCISLSGDEVRIAFLKARKGIS